MLEVFVSLDRVQMFRRVRVSLQNDYDVRYIAVGDEMQVT